MKSAPYTVRTYAQGNHRIENVVTGEVHMVCACKDEALTICGNMIRAWDDALKANPPETEDEAYDKGFDAGVDRITHIVKYNAQRGRPLSEVVEDIERGDVETARPVRLARKLARAAKKKRDREEGGGL